jgi:MoaA/NifB/PqqE/SkfB family radical SAM enzyme
VNELDHITSGHRERELVARLRASPLGDAELNDVLLPFFVKIQIQTTSYCNASCVTCPYPETSQQQSMGRMSEATFETIVDQIAGKGVERASLFLMNEPMVDTRLEAFTAHLHARDPAIQATIITNGTLLDGSRARALAASGMREISVSVNGFTPAAYERTMVGLDFERIVANLVEVGAARGAGELSGLDVRVVALDMGDAREHAEEFSDRVGLPVHLKPVTNRAGSVDVEPFGSTHAQGRARGQDFRPCQRPFVKAYVLFDGTMILCNCDWQRTTVIGNLGEQTLEELWRSPVLDTIRRQHAARELPTDSLCAKCDYPYLI